MDRNDERDGDTGERDSEIEALRDRLTRLSEAGLRINESLDFNTVLQEAVDSARTLAGARYGAITVLGEQKELSDFIASGLTGEEHRRLREMPDGLACFEYLSGLQAPLRVSDISGHISALGMPEFSLPIPAYALLVAPIRHRGAGMGTIYLGHGSEGREFTQEDEETLVMFASQAALVIANARRHRDERQARSQLETLIDTSPIGVLVLDARSGELISHNREAVRMGELLTEPGRPIEEVLEELTVRRADASEVSLREMTLVDVLSGAEMVRAEDVDVSVPDGRPVPMLLNVTPIRTGEGETETVVVTMQDLTPMEESERLRAEFLALVSHELMSPLATIKGSIAAQREGPFANDPSMLASVHEIVEDQVNRMYGIIGGLLDVARIETGALAITPMPDKVADMVDEARRRFPNANRRIDLRVDLPQRLPLVVADRVRIVQVLDNLLKNAAYHSPPGSPIRLSAVREDVHVAVSVSDQGRGITPEHLPNLFRKFSRSRTDDQENKFTRTGLGLAICKGIVEAHGGRIWAESDGADRGSCFTFTIPVADGEYPGAEDEAAAGIVMRGRTTQPGVRVMAVDDDPRDLRYIREALVAGGFTPIVTTNPEDVPRIMEQDRPHLALLDLMLPGKDGIEIMKGILKTSDTPVIFLSVYGEEDIVARAFDRGATDYVVKPFSPMELAARIGAALRRRIAPLQTEPTDPYSAEGGLSIDFATRRVMLSGSPVRLTATEYSLLYELAVNDGRVLTHDQILQRVWGPERIGEPWQVREVVKKLRRKLGDSAANPRFIFTEPRVGYRMVRRELPGGTFA